MTRVKRGTIANKTRRNILAQVKGYRFGRGSKERQANEAIAHAGNYAFAHRKQKKRTFRALWNTRLSAALNALELGNYSTFINAMKKKNIELDRKVLSELAKDKPEIFERIAKQVKA